MLGLQLNPMKTKVVESEVCQPRSNGRLGEITENLDFIVLTAFQNVIYVHMLLCPAT